MDSELTEVSIENIEKVLRYLPYFEDTNNNFYRISDKFSLDPYIYNVKVQEFISTLYSGNFIQPFDWAEWQSEAQKLVTDERLLKDADITIIIKLFTTHIRKDRFCSGHLASMIKKGHILHLLKKLKTITEELKGDVMAKPIIKRNFTPDIFKVVKDDFKFLIKKINESGFEYDFQIRDNYFNLYYKGNSLTKVMCKDAIEPMREYEVQINKKFFVDEDGNIDVSVGNDTRFKDKITTKGDYISIKISNELLHPLFQGKYLKELASKIKDIKFQEEIIFEHMLITDNIDNKDLIIIDRQISDSDKTDNTKIDLLALKHKEGNDYQFCIIEVKLGNNPELKGKVVEQLRTYVEKVENNFVHYKECYEKNFNQKKELGLMFTEKKEQSINIVPDVSGVIVVGRYPGIAKKSIEELGKNHPDIAVHQINYEIKL